MKLSDFEVLTRYMRPESKLFLLDEKKQKLPLAEIKYHPNGADLLFLPGKKALTLSQLLGRLSQAGHQTEFYQADGRDILGFRLDEDYNICLR
ncbi:hypothetical protein [Eupransor demetentiae]|uniref:Uncharacterized protein n=1 Tax=Eupransor demetentiae TaxID=3109584 RepID=A0ABM9N4H0_9LACO|nr:hypothetical protein R54876_GBNLAHCA_00628 [Lactobacillaceae bacterium LMG 33000]